MAINLETKDWPPQRRPLHKPAHSKDQANGQNRNTCYSCLPSMGMILPKNVNEVSGGAKAWAAECKSFCMNKPWSETSERPRNVVVPVAALLLLIETPLPRVREMGGLDGAWGAWRPANASRAKLENSSSSMALEK